VAAVPEAGLASGIVIERGVVRVPEKNGRAVRILPVVPLAGAHVIRRAGRISVLRPVAPIRVYHAAEIQPEVVHVPPGSQPVVAQVGGAQRALAAGYMRVHGMPPGGLVIERANAAAGRAAVNAGIAPGRLVEVARQHGGSGGRAAVAPGEGRRRRQRIGPGAQAGRRQQGCVHFHIRRPGRRGCHVQPAPVTVNDTV